MASYEVLIPPLDGYEQAQEAFSIEPDELACLGLSMIGQVPETHVKTYTYVSDYGYVTPIQWRGKERFLRGLYLHEDEKTDPIGIPRRPEELGGHLRWHQNELKRLEKHGITSALHLPVVVKDEDRWGEAGYGIFTLAEAIPGETLESSVKSWRAAKREPAISVLGKVFNYHIDPDQGDIPALRDIVYTRQYIGHCLVDLDPLASNSVYPNELAHLSAEARRLRSKEGKALQQTIHTEWLRRLDKAQRGLHS